ncbi:MAG: hypothetical protein NXH97_09875 [Rhodobacteraceae bacterium]|nr:hypothetical protein [Paracoccaceae bacterium]
MKHFTKIAALSLALVTASGAVWAQNSDVDSVKMMLQQLDVNTDAVDNLPEDTLLQLEAMLLDAGHNPEEKRRMAEEIISSAQ